MGQEGNCYKPKVIVEDDAAIYVDPDTLIEEDEEEGEGE